MEHTIHDYLSNLLKKVQKNDINDYDAMDEAPQLDKINKVHRWALVRDLHNMAVDIPGLSEAKRCFIGIICTYWLDHQQITTQDYVKGLSEFITMLADIEIDVPKVYEWTAQMICKLCVISINSFILVYYKLFTHKIYKFLINRMNCSGGIFQRYHHIE